MLRRGERELDKVREMVEINLSDINVTLSTRT